MIRWWAVAVFVAGVLMTGCGEEQNPPPQFNVAMSYGGRKLVPLEVPRRVGDRSLIGPAATVEEVQAEVERAASAPAAELAETTAEVPMDLSTPRGAAEAFATLLERGAYDRLEEVLAESIREPIARIVGAIRPLLDARNNLLDALDAKFPDHGLRVVLPPQLTFGLTEAWTVEDVTQDGEDRAVVRVTSADGQITTSWPVVRSDRVWRLMLPAEVPFLTDPQFQQAVADAAARLDRIRSDVAGGRIADVDAAAAAIDEAADATAAQVRGFSSPLTGIR